MNFTPCQRRFPDGLKTIVGVGGVPQKGDPILEYDQE
jgi:hypothetical protein